MNNRIFALLGTAAVSVVAIGAIMLNQTKAAEVCTGQMNFAEGTKLGGPFTAVNHLGETITDKDIITEPTLVYLGYTFCPDVCPLDAARNARVVNLLEERGISVTPVFVSVDPERDTPEVLSEFVEYMHPKMIGVTGSLDQIAAIKKEYGAYSAKAESDDPEYYLVDHTAFTYLMTPDGFVAAYDRALTDEQIADNVSCQAKNGKLG